MNRIEKLKQFCKENNFQYVNFNDNGLIYIKHIEYKNGVTNGKLLQLHIYKILKFNEKEFEIFLNKLKEELVIN